MRHFLKAILKICLCGLVAETAAQHYRHTYVPRYVQEQKIPTIEQVQAKLESGGELDAKDEKALQQAGFMDSADSSGDVDFTSEGNSASMNMMDANSAMN